MFLKARLNRRWAAPGVAVLGVVSIGLVPHVFDSTSAAAPDLPVLTPAELLAKARTAQVTSLSGTITLDSRLGLPSLTSIQGLGGAHSSFSITSLTSGKHSAQVWVDGPDHARFATAAPMQETNWIRNGADLWSYDSTTLTTTHYKLSDNEKGDARATNEPPTTAAPDPEHETPAQFAQDLLDRVTPSTDVTVETPAYVAGRPVYTLVLSPHSADSTVKDVRIAVDAATGLGLDVKITARTGGLALEFGFSDVNFDKPPVSTFNFTPPPGSTVVEAKSAADLLNPAGGETRDGQRFRRDLPSPDANRRIAPDAGSSPNTVTDNVKVLGADWTSVALVSNASVPSQLKDLLRNAPAVSAGSVHGRLLTTKLVNALLLDDGRIAVGAVTPEALEAAVASAG